MVWIWQQIIDELTDFGTVDLDLPENESLRTEIGLNRQHGEAARLDYQFFVQPRIPLRTGAIESRVR